MREERRLTQCLAHGGVVTMGSVNVETDSYPNSFWSRRRNRRVTGRSC